MGSSLAEVERCERRCASGEVKHCETDIEINVTRDAKRQIPGIGMIGKRQAIPGIPIKRRQIPALFGRGQ